MARAFMGARKVAAARWIWRRLPPLVGRSRRACRGGKAADSSDGASIDVINPATGVVVDTVPAATAEDVAEAVKFARAAQPAWNAVPVWKRAEIGNIPIAFKAFSERAKHLYDEVITAGCEQGQDTTVVINGASFYRSFEQPFGGYKYSGIGTEGVMSTFDEMTHTKSIVLKNIL